MKNEPRGNLYLLTGLIIGLAVGVLYSWVISPVQYVDTEPASLAEQYKDDYRKVIALSYQADRNLNRAQERAQLVDGQNPMRALAALAQRLTGANESPEEARALALLASHLAQPPQAVSANQAQATPESTQDNLSLTPTVEPSATLNIGPAIRTATPEVATPTLSVSLTPTVTLTAQPTFTPAPTKTPLTSASSPFTLTSKEEVCDTGAVPGLMQIYVTDAKSQPLSGVKITVTWKDGADTFYTGLVPEIGPGYADFEMKPGVSYTLKIGEVSGETSGLEMKDSCGWKIQFAQGK